MEKKDSEVKKIQFAFSQDALNAIEELAKKTGAASKTEVIRYSLKVFNWIVDMQDEGRKIQAVSENGCNIIELVDQRFPPRKHKEESK